MGSPVPPAPPETNASASSSLLSSSANASSSLSAAVPRPALPLALPAHVQGQEGSFSEQSQGLGKSITEQPPKLHLACLHMRSITVLKPAWLSSQEASGSGFITACVVHTASSGSLAIDWNGV